MIGVSEAWKVAQTGTIVPESYVEITYKVTEPGAQEEAVATTNGAIYYSDYAGVVDSSEGDSPLYATLEHNMWLLDGEFTVLPDSGPYGDTGFVADTIGLTNTPAVTISMRSVHDQAIPGVTLTWSSVYKEYATRFRVTAKSGSRVVATDVFNNNAIGCTVELPIANYDSVVVEVLEWSLPNRRARLENVFLGATQKFSQKDLIKYTHSQTADALSAELPKNSITFSLDNSSGVWNPENPEGNVQYLTERQELTVRYGYKLADGVEWINAGTFWISEWNTPSNGLEVSFTARDAIEFMDDTYSGPRSGTLYDICTTALQQADIPAAMDGTKRYYVSDSLKGTTVDFTDDKTNYPISSVLQMCANAGRCTLRQDRNGVFRIEPMTGYYTGYAITKFVSYSHPEYSMAKPLRAVNVNDGLGGVEIASSGETVFIDNTFIQTEDTAKKVAEWPPSLFDTVKRLKASSGPTRDWMPWMLSLLRVSTARTTQSW